MDRSEGRRIRWICVWAIAAALLPGLARQARADTITWTGGASTNWNASGNWTNSAGAAALPAPGDDVVIDGAARQPTLSLAGGATNINSLIIGANNASTLTVANANTPDRQLVIAGSLTIGPTGMVTHPAPPSNTEIEYHWVNIRVNGDLTLNASGRIDVDGKGYLTGKGPGSKGAASNDGGSHGGLGCTYQAYAPGTVTYGNWRTPTNWGSGGSVSSPGGGTIRLDVKGSATIDGTITTRGGPVTTSGGAGGSIWLTAASLSGSGLIRADGGDHNNTAGGGGGRIAVYVTNDTSVGSVAITAVGGKKTTDGTKPGAAGTVYLETKADAAGQGMLIVDNTNQISPETVTTRLPAGAWDVYQLTIRNRGMLDVWTNAALNLWTNPAVSAVDVTNTGIRVSGGAMALKGIDELTVSNWAFVVDGPGTLSLTGNVVVATNGFLRHSFNPTVETNRMDLAIDGNLTIQPGGRVDADARGYKSPSYGPGKGLSNDGAGHGGLGAGYLGALSSFTYGSITAPTNIGSSSLYSAGGGAIRLTVTGTTTVEGIITAKGAANSNGGSGGSIWLTTGTLAGSGVIRADGGDHSNTAGGGGGRVAIVLTNAASVGSVTITAAGGKKVTTPNFGSGPGAAGTIYIQTKSQGTGQGDLIIDNLSQTSGVRYTTLISSSTTDRVVGNVIWRNNARLELGTNQTLEATGSWTNGTTNAVVANIGSTVVFSGTNEATVYGSNDFYNLTCTNAGKSLLFQSGQRTTVKAGGLITLRGASGANWLGIHSTSNGVQWFLTLQSGSFQDVGYVTVRDSHAGAGETVVAPTGNDEGNNVKWDFASGGVVTWTGNADTNWANTNNWSTLKVPTQIDTVVIPDTANDPVLDATRELAGLTNQSGATLYLGGRDLTVNGRVSNQGSLSASAAETVTFKGDVDFTGGQFVPALSTIRLEGAAPQSVTPDDNTLGDVVIVNPAVTFEDGFAARDIRVGDATNGLVFKGAVQARDITVASTGSVVAFESTVSARGFYGTGPGSRLTFADGALCLFTNLQLRGTAALPIVVSNAPGVAAWKLNAVQWHGVRYVSVRNSDALTPGGPTILAPDSSDGGGNQNWDFSTWHTWSGGVSSNFAAAGNWTNGTVPPTSAWVLIDGDYGTAPWLNAATNLARLTVGIGRTSVLTINGPLAVAGDCVVGPGGVLQHAANGASETYRLTLTVGRDLTVATNGAIDVTAMGYSGNQGPGRSTQGNDGAGHGGLGGDYNDGNSSMTYGSIVTPTNAGSCALYGGTGGGIIRLDVVGRTLVDGLISAKGGNVTPTTCGGAGGSVWLTTAMLEGTGAIHANGGDHMNTAGGGGGRVAVYVTNSATLGSVAISARGGRRVVDNVGPGAAGTVYLHTTAHGAEPGLLIVDNSSQSTLASDTTLISSQVLDRTVGTVIIRNAARFSLATNQAFQVQGSWTNAGVFSAATGSTVTLAGPAAATVTGSNAWHNLAITAPAKEVAFEAGKEQTILGTPVFDGGVTLKSTQPGTRWKIRVPGVPVVEKQPVGVVRVSDSDADAVGGRTFEAQPLSVDLGNNVNWEFLPPQGSIIMVR